MIDDLLVGGGLDEKLILPFSWAALPREHLGIDAHLTRVKTERWNTQLVEFRPELTHLRQ